MGITDKSSTHSSSLKTSPPRSTTTTTTTTTTTPHTTLAVNNVTVIFPTVNTGGAATGQVFSMYGVMGTVLGVVFSIIVLIAVAFFVKQHRRRRQNIEILRNRQRVQPVEMFGITRDEENDFRVHNTHQPLYGQNMTRDNHDDNPTLTVEPSPKQNGHYANSDVVNVNPDYMYDLPRPTGNSNTRNNENPERLAASANRLTTFGGHHQSSGNQMMDETKSKPGKDHLQTATLNVPGNNNKLSSSIKHSQSLGKYESENRNIRAKLEADISVCEEIPDYENSPEKVRKAKSTQNTTSCELHSPNVKNMLDEMKHRSGRPKDSLRTVTLNVPDKNKKPNSAIKYSQSLGRYDSQTRNTRQPLRRDNNICEEYPDYENSPEKVRKVKFQQGNNLNTVPPPTNGKMMGLDIQKNSTKSAVKTKVQRQKSDYEDPDNVVAIRKMNAVKESSKDVPPEYSNLIIQGLVVKEEVFPDSANYDYENEHSVNKLRQKGPPLPTKKRAHTTAAYDRPTRPVVKKKVRNYSTSEHRSLDEADDMYLPMTGGALEEDDMYMPMDSHNNGVQNSFIPQKKSPPKVSPKPKSKPEPIPHMVPKRSFDKTTLLSVQRPPPCGVSVRSNTEYVNYDEDSRYVNLFRSKSNDDVYIYADSHFHND